jgi:hypothetical protein
MPLSAQLPEPNKASESWQAVFAAATRPPLAIQQVIHILAFSNIIHDPT